MALWRNFRDDCFFERDELDPALLARVAELEAKTLERLKLAGAEVERVSFAKNKVIDPRSNELEIILRSRGEGRKGGRIACSRAGETLRVMTP